MRHNAINPAVARSGQSATRWGGVGIYPSAWDRYKDEPEQPLPAERRGQVSEAEDEIVRRARRRAGLAAKE
mgnify:CR=1 FL=1